MRAASIGASVRCASAGLRYLLVTQRNARIHVAAGLLVLALALLLHLPPGECATLVLVSALVLVAETLNTALESLVDLVTTDYHPLAKQVKDLAAGAVWLAALAAVVIGVLLLLPPLWALVPGRR